MSHNALFRAVLYCTTPKIFDAALRHAVDTGEGYVVVASASGVDHPYQAARVAYTDGVLTDEQFGDFTRARLAYYQGLVDGLELRCPPGVTLDSLGLDPQDYDATR